VFCFQKPNIPTKEFSHITWPTKNSQDGLGMSPLSSGNLSIEDHHQAIKNKSPSNHDLFLKRTEWRIDTIINILLANKVGALIHYNKNQEEQLQCLGILTTSSSIITNCGCSSLILVH
jgi:hypothetical protein